MAKNREDSQGWRGSVVLVASTSGYIGGTEVVSYVSSKHGVIGLLRSSYAEAGRRGVRVNAVAPFVTPTAMTGAYSDAWTAHGMPTNSPAGVAKAVVSMASAANQQGECYLVSRFQKRARI
jgi:NAD(P)-dependent dehydrogenase (short-subunit alcohol dehydrogenase family)